MARYTGPKHKVARRLGVDVFEKDSPSLRRRLRTRPGLHGRRPRRRTSEYGLQLLEKQKARATYGVLERQFRRLIERAQRRPGETGEELVALLESRLDNVVYRLGFAKSRAMARQLVNHGHVRVDSRRVTIPSFQVKPGETIEISETAQEIPDVVQRVAEERDVP
ncbi:MAG: small subunit ribosomal protein, partial [Thermomicrobiales bacterium]|nr:small subunit ribosomal protein [Thermomicrobiales bacterium]